MSSPVAGLGPAALALARASARGAANLKWLTPQNFRGLARKSFLNFYMWQVLICVYLLLAVGAWRLVAKVSHRLVCQIASGFCEEFKHATGLDSSECLQSGRLLEKMHHSSRTRHENQTTKSYVEAGLSAPVPISYADLDGLSEHPWLRPSDFLRVFVQENKLGLLMGGSSFDIIEKFWCRFQVHQPDHPIFSLLDPHDRKYTLPLMLYADEGQTLRKQSIMVISIQPAVGFGTHAASGFADPEAMGLNFKGSCYRTRFLVSTLLRRIYKKKPHIVDSLIKQIVLDCNETFESGVGVLLDGVSKKLRGCIVGLKGDWPILSRLGHLTRHFHRMTKGGKTASAGICHLCLAGCPGIPYQQYTEAAAWCGTYLSEAPFDPADPSPLWDLPQSPAEELFYHFDVFHTWHKGIYAELAGSAVATWFFLVCCML